MKSRSSLLVSLVFIAVALSAAAWLYPRLPAQVAAHWNAQAQVDGYWPRAWVASVPVAAIALLALLAAVLPAVSPRRFRMDGFVPVWHLAMLAAQGLVLVLALAVLLHGAGYAVPVPKVALLGAGVFFMVVGNYMGKLRRNFFIGIRTPWTLASEVVWERTHRLAGWLLMLAGLAVVIGIVAGVALGCLTIVLVGSALAPCLYSLLIYRRAVRS